MSQALYPFYESELFFIRRLSQEFAAQYPAAAARLQLEPGRSADPHVERLIESFALLTARIQHKIHDDFPELTDALLQILYPHYLAPVPSTGMVQFDLDPTRANPKGVNIAAGSMLRTQRVMDVVCRYRTCYPLTLWPIQVMEAKLQPPPFPPGLNPPDKAIAALRLRLQVQGELNFSQLQIDKLRFFLNGDSLLTSPLYELIMNHTLQMVVRFPENKNQAPIVMDPNTCLHPVGFNLDEGLFPYPRQVFPGYRLLTEFFAFPQKFLFVDVSGWEKVRAAGPYKQIELVFFVNQTSSQMEQTIETSSFRMGVTPIVNLFEHTTEPINLSHTRTEYKIVPEVGHPHGYEIYSIESVTGATPDGKNREYRPFYSYRHGGDRSNREAFWYASRRQGTGDGDRGTDMYLHLADINFDPTKTADTTLVIRTLCTNRDLAERLPRVGAEVRFDTEFSAPGTRIRCLRNPNPPQRSPLRRGSYWRLLSHLSLNHLSLGDGNEGREALQELLRLYDFSDPNVQPQAAAVARQLVEGITGLKSKRVVNWLGGPAGGGFCRGIEIQLEFDESKYVGASPYLYASVLERFFGLYVSINSFSQLVVKVKQQEGELKRWPPRAGEQPLL